MPRTVASVIKLCFPEKEDNGFVGGWTKDLSPEGERWN